MSVKESTLKGPITQADIRPFKNLGHWRWVMLGFFMILLAWIMLTHQLVQLPQIDAHWARSPEHQLVLVSSHETSLKHYVGQTLLGFVSAPPSVQLLSLDALVLEPSARWIVDDGVRQKYVRMQQQLSQFKQVLPLRLLMSNGDLVQVSIQGLGWSGLPLRYWFISFFVLGLCGVALAVLATRVCVLNVLYALMALATAGNLSLIAINVAVQLGFMDGLALFDYQARLAFDLICAGAIVHAVLIYPNCLPWAKYWAALIWGLLFLVYGVLTVAHVVGAWWWVQVAWIFVILLSLCILSFSYRTEPHPFVTVLRRFNSFALAAWVLLTLALATSTHAPHMRYAMAEQAVICWTIFFATLLFLVPFLSQSIRVIRQFALLTAVSTIAISANLLLVSVWLLSPFTSFLLSLFLSIGVYVGSKKWLVNQLLCSSLPSAERMFERLYRVAREVEEHPERTPRLLLRLLQEMFAPLEFKLIQARVESTQVIDDGSALLLAVPLLNTRHDELVEEQAILLRFAHRGRRLFTSNDVRLTDRLIEQLARAVAYDKAVERGRSEERLRLAQDLHDDIGARLLTLMYTAPNPEIEEYVRHTLQDLKTLTRGLATGNHRLSFAAAEWKADLSHRLSAAYIDLDWQCEFDVDAQLSVVQWSALTRIMRELINNIIAHANAKTAQVQFRLFKQQMILQVADNGLGRNPQSWAHGLGLGGIRKRAKQLGASVEWLEASPRGTICRVFTKEWGVVPPSTVKTNTPLIELSVADLTS